MRFNVFHCVAMNVNTPTVLTVLSLRAVRIVTCVTCVSYTRYYPVSCRTEE